MLSIVIIGPGAIGGTIAAHLSDVHPGSVRLAARSRFDLLEVDTRVGRLRIEPQFIPNPETASPADWVLVATKAYAVEPTTRWLRSLVGAETRVAILQNGVEHVERFSRVLPAERLVPVVVRIPAHRSCPGLIIQGGDGDLVVPDTVAGLGFAGLFVGTAIRVVVTADFMTAAWRKLALNAPGAINAALLDARLDVARPATARLVRATVAEVVAVGRAEGADLDDGLGDEILASMSRPGDGIPNSLHADRLARRPMEIDARNGAVVRIGARHGIATPVNRILVDLLSSVEVAGSSLTRSNVGGP